MRTYEHPGFVDGPDVVPKVKRQHIVPRFYLRSWRSASSRLQMLRQLDARRHEDHPRAHVVIAR